MFHLDIVASSLKPPWPGKPAGKMAEESSEKAPCEHTATLPQNTVTKKPKTKIVVHINNYVLSKSPSDDNLRLNTPETSVDQLTPSRAKLSDKAKKALPLSSTARNDYIILHAKSIKFPVKITPAYEIYPTTNVHDDKYDKYDKYTRDHRHISNNAYSSHRYDRLLDLNFKLPALSSLQNNQIKPNLTYPNKASPKMSLPNYLKAQYNLQPPHLLNYKPSSLQPLYNASNRLKELSASAPISIGNYSRLEARDPPPPPPPPKPESPPPPPPPPPPPKIVIPFELASQHTFADFNDASVLSQFDQQQQRYFNPNSTFIDQSQFSSGLKLPQINPPVDIPAANPDNNCNRAQEEPSRLFNLSYQIDDEINKIIRNYPSIVVRRRGVPGGNETTASVGHKQRRLNNQSNHSSYKGLADSQPPGYQKAASTVLQPSVVISKPIQSRRDLAHTIDYGKLI